MTNKGIITIINMAEQTLGARIKTAKSVKDKWRIKNTEFNKLSFPISFSKEGLDIEVVSAWGNSEDLLEIQLNVLRNGKIVDVNAPFLFQNPPVIHNEKLNITEALKAFVLDTIKTQIK